MIARKSLLRNVPTKTHPAHVAAFDAICYSLDIVDLAYNRLEKNLFDFVYPKKTARPSMPELFSDIWSIINNVTVFQDILAGVFGIDKKDLLFESIRNVKELRHTSQHLAERIEEVISTSNIPIYGKLSWYAQKETNAKEGIITSVYSGSFTGKDRVSNSVAHPLDGLLDRRVYNIDFTGVIRTKGEEGKQTFREETVRIENLIMGLEKVVGHLEAQLAGQFNELNEEELSKIHRKDLVFQLKTKKVK